MKESFIPITREEYYQELSSIFKAFAATWAQAAQFAADGFLYSHEVTIDTEKYDMAASNASRQYHPETAIDGIWRIAERTSALTHLQIIQQIQNYVWCMAAETRKFLMESCQFPAEPELTKHMKYMQAKCTPIIYYWTWAPELIYEHMKYVKYCKVSREAVEKWRLLDKRYAHEYEQSRERDGIFTTQFHCFNGINPYTISTEELVKRAHLHLKKMLGQIISFMTGYTESIAAHISNPDTAFRDRHSFAQSENLSDDLRKLFPVVAQFDFAVRDRNQYADPKQVVWDAYTHGLEGVYNMAKWASPAKDVTRHDVQFGSKYIPEKGNTVTGIAIAPFHLQPMLFNAVQAARKIDIHAPNVEQYFSFLDSI